MDSMKGSLSAPAACEAVTRGLLDVCPTVTVRTKPMADGGEGTARVLLASRSGRWIPCRTMGPLSHMRVEAGYGWLPEGPEGAIAVVEMAAASGLALLDREELDPLHATTFGTGQLLDDATRRGAGQVWLAVGGSATVDGGVGAALAVGWRFLDAAGRDVGLGGERLERIARIEPPSVSAPVVPAASSAPLPPPVLGRPLARPPVPLPPVPLPPVRVLCDVENTLLGTEGAARVFGPQKGATAEEVGRLERGLSNLADMMERDLGVDVRSLRGGGAAGGLAAGAAAFFGAKLVPGVDVVAEAIGLDESLEGAAWVVTGEGRFDAQSLHGKVVSGVVRRAMDRGVRVAVIAGRDDLGASEAARHGVSAVEACVGGDSGDRDELLSMEHAAEHLRSAAGRFASRHLAGAPGSGVPRLGNP